MGVMDARAGLALKDKFRAASRALRATFEAHLAGGRHTYEKGMRHEQVLIDFLATHLPPRYGVSRGEVVDSKGGIARQADVVIYDAHHAPLLQESEASKVFAAESVYAVIEMKPTLSGSCLTEAVEAVRSAKALDRSAVVGAHEGHRFLHGRPANLPMFGAVFSLKAPSIQRRIVPTLGRLHERLPWEQRVDAVCVLGEALVYHFAPAPQPNGKLGWSAAVAGEGTTLGYYESKEDTLFYFYLFLLYQLGMRELFPPDLLRYVSGLPGPPLRIYQGKRVWPAGEPMVGVACEPEADDTNVRGRFKAANPAPKKR